MNQNEINVKEKFQYALSCYGKGLLAQAGNICTEILQDNPTYFEAMHLLEIVTKNINRPPVDPTWKEPPVNPYEGEMLPYERYKLFNWIIKINPKILLEVGTGNGGGSSFYISEALLQAKNSGELYTCDPYADNPFIIFSQKRYKDIVFYYKIESRMLITYMIQKNKIPDFVFFDGPEIPELALNDFKLLEPYLRKGCYFSMHDWHSGTKRNYDNANSVKSALLKPYLESHKQWRCLEELSGIMKNANYCDMPFDSVGLCLYEKIE